MNNEPFSPVLVGPTDPARTTLDSTVDSVSQPNCENESFFACTPSRGRYLELINQLLDVDLSDKSYIDAAMVQCLCEDAIEVLNKESSLLELSFTSDCPLVLVGDVHGQHADLVTHILSQQCKRDKGSPDKSFLFMGDYIDRGPNGVEVVMLLLALKVEYPDKIYLLRGNHEERQTSQTYGFQKECSNKFLNAFDTFEQFNNVFCSLPLAAYVKTQSHTFFAAHGGLSPDLVSLDNVRSINRVYYEDRLDITSKEIVDGLLWSDPTDEDILFARNSRGCGMTFGENATKKFCADNGIDFVARAHQLTSQGYCYTHDKKCLTIFSAPNYCGFHGNKGAIMILDKDINFVQYETARPSGGGIFMPYFSSFLFTY